MPLPKIDPPLINSASPWATDAEDLQALFDCPHTGAITTRTATLNGFPHDRSVHQHTFFNPVDQTVKPTNAKDGKVSDAFSASLNTLGYSPLPLDTYLSILNNIVANSNLPDDAARKKPFIISVTGSAEEVVECYCKLRNFQAKISNPLCMEINLSCPNIPGNPPPAYASAGLLEYFRALGPEKSSASDRRVYIGIKTPPYTYHDQFQHLIDGLQMTNRPSYLIDFITATNTLGSSLLLAEDGSPALQSASGLGLGGMAGAPLHPLALGNVKTLRTMLNRYESTQLIDIIGIGGVGDRAGFDRMRAVGASVVGVATALGREGVGIFDKIFNGTRS